MSVLLLVLLGLTSRCTAQFFQFQQGGGGGINLEDLMGGAFGGGGGFHGGGGGYEELPQEEEEEEVRRAPRAADAPIFSRVEVRRSRARCRGFRPKW